MVIIPILLLAVLLAVVIGANSAKKKGTLSEASYQSLVSVISIVVTIAALILLYFRLRR